MGMGMITAHRIYQGSKGGCRQSVKAVWRSFLRIKLDIVGFSERGQTNSPSVLFFFF